MLSINRRERIEMHTIDVGAMPAQHGIKMRELIGAHWFVLITASLLNLIDGFDIAAVAFAAGGIAQKWKLAPVELGVVLASAQFGSMIGAISLGTLTDRFERRPMLIFACLLTGAAMFAAAFVHDLWGFIALRAVSGVGLGLLGPLVVAYGAEFMPASMRGTMSAIIVGSLPVGSVVGGLFAAWLIPAYGWQLIFLLGGIAPVVMILAVLRLPPSIVDLKRRGNDAEAKHLADKFSVEEPAELRANVSATKILFRDRAFRMRFFTVALTIFLAASVAHFLNTWLPRIVETNGGALTIAALSASVTHSFGLMGCIAFGAMMDRFPAYRITAGALALGAVPIVLLGRVDPGMTVLFAAGITGFFVIGGANSCNAFSSVSFPSELRVAVIGYTTVVGRLAGIVAPTGAGMILSLGGGPAILFDVCAVLLLAGAAVMAIGGRMCERHDASA
jgi:AAHS family 4-hydroxybenzoate transporter-like MFS transporter